MGDMIEKMAQDRAMEIAARLLGLHPELVTRYLRKPHIREALKPAAEAVTVPELSPERIRLIRRALATSQKDFEGKFGIPARTLEGWEQGRRKPDPVALILLRVIEANPEAVTHALQGTVAIPYPASDQATGSGSPRVV